MIDEFGMLEIEIGEGRSLAVTDPMRARRRGGHGPRYRYTVVVQVEPGRFHGHLELGLRRVRVLLARLNRSQYISDCLYILRHRSLLWRILLLGEQRGTSTFGIKKNSRQ